MRHCTVIAVGRMKNRALAQLADDYAGRLARGGRLYRAEWIRSGSGYHHD